MSVRARRQAREWALKVLYQTEVGKRDAVEAIEETVADEQLEPEVADFMRMLVVGAMQRLESLDQAIAALSHEWTLDRQPVIDRNILRMASFEILYCPDIPPAASINEAVELAKRFSTAESGRFVNGVLGALLDSLPAEARKAVAVEGRDGEE